MLLAWELLIFTGELLVVSFFNSALFCICTSSALIWLTCMRQLAYVARWVGLDEIVGLMFIILSSCLSQLRLSYCRFTIRLEVGSSRFIETYNSSKLLTHRTLSSYYLISPSKFHVKGHPLVVVVLPARSHPALTSHPRLHLPLPTRRNVPRLAAPSPSSLLRVVPHFWQVSPLVTRRGLGGLELHRPYFALPEVPVLDGGPVGVFQVLIL